MSVTFHGYCVCQRHSAWLNIEEIMWSLAGMPGEVLSVAITLHDMIRKISMAAQCWG